MSRLSDNPSVLGDLHSELMARQDSIRKSIRGRKNSGRKSSNRLSTRSYSEPELECTVFADDDSDNPEHSTSATTSLLSGKRQLTPEDSVLANTGGNGKQERFKRNVPHRESRSHSIIDTNNNTDKMNENNNAGEMNENNNAGEMNEYNNTGQMNEYNNAGEMNQYNNAGEMSQDPGKPRAHSVVVTVQKPSTSTPPVLEGLHPTQQYRRSTMIPMSGDPRGQQRHLSYIPVVNTPRDSFSAGDATMYAAGSTKLLAPPGRQSYYYSPDDQSFSNFSARVMVQTEQNLKSVISRMTVLIIMIVVLLLLVLGCGALLMWKVVKLSGLVMQAGGGQGFLGLSHTGPTYPLDPNAVKDCTDVMAMGYTDSGLYQVAYINNSTVTVYCDMESADGGWLVMMRRMDNSEDFNKEWQSYKAGFGKKDKEFWMGNEFMHHITNRDRKYKLRVDLTSFTGDQIWAEYYRFSIAPQSDGYRLSVGNYTGSAGDSLAYHNGCRFSTTLVDNDFSEENCAERDGAPWWFRNCHHVFLTGPYGSYPAIEQDRGITWRVPWGLRIFAKAAEMKIKPILPVGKLMNL